MDNNWMSSYIQSLSKLSIQELTIEMLMYYRIHVIKNDDMNCLEYYMFKECQSEFIKRQSIINDMTNGKRS